MSPGFDTSDEELVALCLEGSAEAWSTLVDRYKNFVFAILRRSGVPQPEALDLFQEVWIELYRSLGALKDPGAVRAWLGTVSRRHCHRFRERNTRLQGQQAVEADLERPADESHPDDWLERCERDQAVRDCLDRLPPRCVDLIRMLFFEDPPLPYKEVASRLGIAVGSIGFIRGRCLEKLRALLEERSW